MAQAHHREFRGIWTALCTPFNAAGAIDWPAFNRLLERQVDAGVQGVVLAGSTGEGATLTVQEKLALIKKAKALVGSKIGIMAGTGGSCTSQSLELSKLAITAGADSLLLVTPPYNKPNPQGLLAHFRSLAQASSVPLCLYHVPGRTAQSLSPQLLAQLCQIEGVNLVKEASGDLGFFSEALQAACSAQGSPVPFLSGDDPTFLASLALGGSGCISVVSNLFPREWVALQEAFERGEQALALKLHTAFFALNRALYWESNPCPLKFALAELGLLENQLRLPLAPVAAETAAKIARVLKQTQIDLAALLGG